MHVIIIPAINNNIPDLVDNPGMGKFPENIFHPENDTYDHCNDNNGSQDQGLCGAGKEFFIDGFHGIAANNIKLGDKCYHKNDEQ